MLLVKFSLFWIVYLMFFLFITELLAIMKGAIVLNKYNWFLGKTPYHVHFIWTFKFMLSVMVIHLFLLSFQGDKSINLNWPLWWKWWQWVFCSDCHSSSFQIKHDAGSCLPDNQICLSIRHWDYVLLPFSTEFWQHVFRCAVCFNICPHPMNQPINPDAPLRIFQ